MADTANKKVVFVGGTGEHKNTGSVHIPDAGVTLHRNQPASVSDEVAQELLSGDSKRFKGLKFEVADEDEARATRKTSRATAGDTGGPGGTSAPDGDPGPHV